MPGNRDIPVPDAGTGEMASPFGQGTAVCPFVDLGGQVNGRDLECPQVAAGVEQVVLYEVKRLACFASEYENDFIKAMIGRSAKVAENTALRKQRELDALTARDRELDMLFERLYEDNVAGKIDDARFAKMSKRYEQEQGENAKKIKALRLELKKDESKRMDIDDFLETVRRYTDATTITKRMVAELIDHIEVYHAEKQDGITNQRVVIHYNCIGAFDVPDRRKIPEADIIMETRKGVALSYAPEQVAV